MTEFVDTEFQIPSVETVKLSELNDLLTCAVEGGIGYWSYVQNYEWAADDNGWSKETTVEIAEFDDGTMEESTEYRLVKASDLASVLPDITKKSYLKGSIRDIIDNMDAETGDIAVQLFLFGDIVYG